MDFLKGKSFKPEGFKYRNKFSKWKCAETRKLFGTWITYFKVGSWIIYHYIFRNFSKDNLNILTYQNFSGVATKFIFFKLRHESFDLFTVKYWKKCSPNKKFSVEAISVFLFEFEVVEAYNIFTNISMLGKFNEYFVFV